LRYLGWPRPEQLVLRTLSGIIEVLNISNEWKKDVKPLVFAARRIEKNPGDLVPAPNRARAFLRWLVESELLSTEQPRGNEPRPNTDEDLLKAAVDGARRMTSSKFRAALREKLNRDRDFRERFKREFSRKDIPEWHVINVKGYERWLLDFEKKPATPSDDNDTFTPAHEKSLVYVMRELEEKTGEFIDYAIRDFDRRVWNGYIKPTVSLEARRSEGGLVGTLKELCPQLDLDPSVFLDDLEVFNHLRGLVWFDPARTGNTTVNKGENTDNEEQGENTDNEEQGENTDNEEQIALYRYAAYSRFVFYAFWLVEGPARFGRSASTSSQKDMEKLKEWIDEQTSQTATGDSANEFLLLMLADQRSALFNWLRSVRACTVRNSFFDYEKRLDPQQKGSNTHFGIPVIPARYMRLSELQAHLKVGDQAQKPIRLRSVYDLVPRQSDSAKERNTGIVSSDQRYVDTKRFISISNNWEGEVAINAETMQGVFAWLDDRSSNLTVELKDIQQQYLGWLVGRVFKANVGQPDEPPNEIPQLTGDALILVQVLWLVSPTFKAKFRRESVPSIGEPSEVEQYREVHRRISSYCLDTKNANVMKYIFFGGADPEIRERAPGLYDAWLQKFRDRAVD
jgi:hypothetical protein